MTNPNKKREHEMTRSATGGSDTERASVFTAKRIIAFILTTSAVFGLLASVDIDEERAYALTARRVAGSDIFPVLAEEYRARFELADDELIQARLVLDGPSSALPELVRAASDDFELVESAAEDNVPVLRIDCPQRDGWVTFIGSLEGTEGPASATGRIGDWVSVVPPILAILVALFFRRLLIAMFGGIFVGALLFFQGNPFGDLFDGTKKYLWGNVSDDFNLYILAFTIALVGMVLVTTRAGGSQGLIDAVARLASSARSTRVATALMGVVIFFDDYANSIVVGTTVRPMSDRWKISREKLAYLVDSTAAPIAGLAIISTWIAFEIGQLQPLIDQTGLSMGGGGRTSGYSLFIAMLPFRFYCLTTLMFVFTNAASSRDFGPMLHAERRAASTGQVLAPNARPLTSRTISKIAPEPGIPCRWINAVIPVFVVVILVIVGMLWSGHDAVIEEGVTFNALSFETWKYAFGGAESGKVLLFASLGGSAVAIVMVVAQRLLSLQQALVDWLRAIPAMHLAFAILLCAWAIQDVCKDLGTSAFLVSAVGDTIPPMVFPLFSFLAAAGIAFATGTSWGTMGILLPVVLPWSLALSEAPDVPFIVVLLSCAAVLDGAIMGDHCSPISDTTVLSSIATSCDHVDHVRTQMPYALTCMGLACLAYLALAYGVSVWIAYGALFAGVLGVLFLVGKKIDEPQSS